MCVCVRVCVILNKHLNHFYDFVSISSYYKYNLHRQLDNYFFIVIVFFPLVFFSLVNLPPFCRGGNSLMFCFSFSFIMFIVGNFGLPVDLIITGHFRIFSKTYV